MRSGETCSASRETDGRIVIDTSRAAMRAQEMRTSTQSRRVERAGLSVQRCPRFDVSSAAGRSERAGLRLIAGLGVLLVAVSSPGGRVDSVQLAALHGVEPELSAALTSTNRHGRFEPIGVHTQWNGE
jgi:hypothetical protein